MLKDSKPLKQLSEEEEFSTMANWVVHRLPKGHNMVLRLKEQLHMTGQKI